MPRIKYISHLKIRLKLYGCTNRPFYHIVVIPHKKPRQGKELEQLGTYDPMPNMFNEKLVSVNFERIQYWLGRKAEISRPVEHLLGLCGFLPIHPTSYLEATRNRKIMAETEQNKEEKAESGTGS